MPQIFSNYSIAIIQESRKGFDHHRHIFSFNTHATSNQQPDTVVKTHSMKAVIAMNPIWFWQITTNLILQDTCMIDGKALSLVEPLEGRKYLWLNFFLFWSMISRHSKLSTAGEIPVDVSTCSKGGPHCLDDRREDSLQIMFENTMQLIGLPRCQA